MARSTSPFMRPWNKSLLPTGILLTIIVFLYVLQYQANVNEVSSNDFALCSDRNASDLTSQPTSQHDQSVPQASSTSPAKRKAIITSVQRKDETTADWLAEMLPDWDAVVYVTDRTSDEAAEPNDSPIRPYSLPVNRGREASVYLTYIIHRYYELPEYMVFVHGKQYQIHNDEPMLDTFPLIQRLNLDYVAEQGYTSLRCNWMHCPRAQVEPELGYDDGFWDTRGLYASAYQLFFPNETIPKEVTGPCCAQFAVTRETVQRWPIDKYEQIRQWMWTQEGDQASMKSGLVLEYMWHILFGKPAWYCPPAEECYCKTWGMCDLTCEREGWCLGRTWLNPEKNPLIGLPPQLPAGWPAEGQGSKGAGDTLPYDGWWNDAEEILNH